MRKEYTCIVCPNGCSLQAEIDGGIVISSSGNLCDRGKTWLEEEISAPKRNFATTVSVEGGDMETVSVRLSSPIPKDKIFKALEIIHSAKAKAPVHIGDVIIKDILSLGADVIATRNVEKI